MQYVNFVAKLSDIQLIFIYTSLFFAFLWFDWLVSGGDKVLKNIATLMLKKPKQIYNSQEKLLVPC